jgi:membrane-associated protease RseP (regulator of RpoE activity)
MKYSQFLLLWLILIFGLIVFTEHHGMMQPLLLWATLLLLFIIMSSLAGVFRAAGRVGRASLEAVEGEAAPKTVSQATMREYAEAIAPYLALTGWKVKGRVAEFEGKLRTGAPAALAGLSDAFRSQGLSPLLLEGDHSEVRIALIPAESNAASRSKPRWWLHGLLFFLTFLTTTWAGALQQGVNLWRTPDRFAAGLPYSIGLLLILGAHEFGHYIAARYHDVDVTPPYFVPVPFGLGTFGAFIAMKSLAQDRRSTFDVAVAGPLAGLVLAIPALWIGLARSTIVPGGAPLGPGVVGLDVNSSLLLAFLAKLAFGAALAEGHRFILHPLAFAGWIGLLVTALNLLPIGQLDGGHMAHALLGSRKGHTVSVVALVALFLLSFFVWPNLMAWAFIVYFLAGTRDVPSRDDITPLSVPRKLLGIFAFGVLMAILLPVPSQFYHAVAVQGSHF